MKKFAIRTLIYALLFNAIISALPISEANAAIIANSPDQNQKILLCTSAGYKWVKISELESENNQHAKKDDCQMCHAACPHKNLALNAAGSTIISYSSEEELYYKTDYYYISGHQIKHAPPRSPPYFS